MRCPLPALAVLLLLAAASGASAQSLPSCAIPLLSLPGATSPECLAAINYLDKTVNEFTGDDVNDIDVGVIDTDILCPCADRFSDKNLGKLESCLKQLLIDNNASPELLAFADLEERCPRGVGSTTKSQSFTFSVNRPSVKSTTKNCPTRLRKNECKALCGGKGLFSWTKKEDGCEGLCECVTTTTSEPISCPVPVTRGACRASCDGAFTYRRRFKGCKGLCSCGGSSGGGGTDGSGPVGGGAGSSDGGNNPLLDNDSGSEGGSDGGSESETCPERSTAKRCRATCAERFEFYKTLGKCKKVCQCIACPEELSRNKCRKVCKNQGQDFVHSDVSSDGICANECKCVPYED